MPQKMFVVIISMALQSIGRDRSLESIYGKNVLKECGDELIQKRYISNQYCFGKKPTLKIAILKKFIKF